MTEHLSLSLNIGRYHTGMTASQWRSAITEAVLETHGDHNTMSHMQLTTSATERDEHMATWASRYNFSISSPLIEWLSDECDEAHATLAIIYYEPERQFYTSWNCPSSGLPCGTFTGPASALELFVQFLNQLLTAQVITS
jgi:hypothetical protein